MGSPHIHNFHQFCTEYIHQIAPDSHHRNLQAIVSVHRRILGSKRLEHLSRRKILQFRTNLNIHLRLEYCHRHMFHSQQCPHPHIFKSMFCQKVGPKIQYTCHIWHYLKSHLTHIFHNSGLRTQKVWFRLYSHSFIHRLLNLKSHSSLRKRFVKFCSQGKIFLLIQHLLYRSS